MQKKNSFCCQAHQKWGDNVLKACPSIQRSLFKHLPLPSCCGRRRSCRGSTRRSCRGTFPAILAKFVAEEVSWAAKWNVPIRGGLECCGFWELAGIPSEDYFGPLLRQFWKKNVKGWRLMVEASEKPWSSLVEGDEGSYDQLSNKFSFYTSWTALALF